MHAFTKFQPYMPIILRVMALQSSKSKASIGNINYIHLQNDCKVTQGFVTCTIVFAMNWGIYCCVGCNIYVNIQSPNVLSRKYTAYLQ